MATCRFLVRVGVGGEGGGRGKRHVSGGGGGDVEGDIIRHIGGCQGGADGAGSTEEEQKEMEAGRGRAGTRGRIAIT